MFWKRPGPTGQSIAEIFSSTVNVRHTNTACAAGAGFVACLKNDRFHQASTPARAVLRSYLGDHLTYPACSKTKTAAIAHDIMPRHASPTPGKPAALLLFLPHSTRTPSSSCLPRPQSMTAVVLDLQATRLLRYTSFNQHRSTQPSPSLLGVCLRLSMRSYCHKPAPPSKKQGLEHIKTTCTDLPLLVY